MSQLDLPAGYEIRALTEEEFRPLFRENRAKIFGDTLLFRAHDALSPAEKESQKALQARMGQPFSLHFGLFQGESLAGWTFGRQIDAEKFSMVNSAVLPEHRSKGLYKSLLKAVLAETMREGFQIVYSRHTATNSAILVPKLKAGFVVSGFEISDTFGLLVHLSYFTNPVRRKAMEFRSGQLIADDELKRFLPG